MMSVAGYGGGFAFFCLPLLHMSLGVSGDTTQTLTCCVAGGDADEQTSLAWHEITRDLAFEAWPNVSAYAVDTGGPGRSSGCPSHRPNGARLHLFLSPGWYRVAVESTGTAVGNYSLALECGSQERIECGQEVSSHTDGQVHTAHATPGGEGGHHYMFELTGSHRSWVTVDGCNQPSGMQSTKFSIYSSDCLADQVEDADCPDPSAQTGNYYRVCNAETWHWGSATNNCTNTVLKEIAELTDMNTSDVQFWTDQLVNLTADASKMSGNDVGNVVIGLKNVVAALTTRDAAWNNGAECPPTGCVIPVLEGSMYVVDNCVEWMNMMAMARVNANAVGTVGSPEQAGFGFPGIVDDIAQEALGVVAQSPQMDGLEILTDNVVVAVLEGVPTSTGFEWPTSTIPVGRLTRTVICSKGTENTACTAQGTDSSASTQAIRTDVPNVNVPMQLEGINNLQFKLYLTDRLFQRQPEKLNLTEVVATKVIGIEVNGSPSARSQDTCGASGCATVTFPGITGKCAYWVQDVHDMEPGTTDLDIWSDYEVNTRLQGNDTVCVTHHLTSFAVLVDSDLTTSGGIDDLSKEDAEALSYITTVGLFISIPCYVLMIVLYSIYSRALNLPNKIALNLAGTVAALMVIFLIASNGSFGDPADVHTETSCKITAVLLQYAMYCMFMWFAIESFHMYTCFVKVFTFRKSVAQYCAVAYTVPMLVAVPIAIGWWDDYGDPNKAVCFINIADKPDLKYALLSPLFVVTAFSLYVWARVINVIYKALGASSPRSDGESDRQSLLNAVYTGLPFFLTMGPTWGLTFLLDFGSTVVLHYAFGIINALSGLLYLACRGIKDPNLRREMGFTSHHSGKTKTSQTNTLSSGQTHDSTSSLERTTSPSQKARRKQGKGQVVRRRDRPAVDWIKLPVCPISPDSDSAGTCMDVVTMPDTESQIPSTAAPSTGVASPSSTADWATAGSGSSSTHVHGGFSTLGAQLQATQGESFSTKKLFVAGSNLLDVAEPATPSETTI